MNAFLSDTLYRSQLARNQVLLAQAAVERRARTASKSSSTCGGAHRLLVFAPRSRQPAGARRVTAAD